MLTEVRMFTDALWRCRDLLGQTHLSDTPGMQEISPGPSLGCWEDSVSSCLLMGHELFAAWTTPYVG